jgi:hypothetical protein
VLGEYRRAVFALTAAERGPSLPRGSSTCWLGLRSVSASTIVVASEPSGGGGNGDLVAWGMLMAWVNGRAL